MTKERKARHDDEHAGSCPQAAAAWSWFQHSGGTASQTEGTRLAQRQQTGLMSSILGPSRFKVEAENRMVSATDHDSSCRKLSIDEAMESCARRRRHSFHHQLLRTPTMITTSSPSINHDKKQWSCSSASSLFDSFELETMSKQLEESLTDGGPVPISTSWAGGDEAGASVPAKPKFPACNYRTDSHKVTAGMRDESGLRYKHENHHHHHALLHQFFHFRMPAPFCKSIDIANSNVNILHTATAEAGAPKKLRHKQSHETDPPIKHSKKSGEDIINPDYNLVNHPNDGHNSHDKVPKRPHHVIHLADFFSKVSKPLIHLSHLHASHRSNTDLGTNHHRSNTDSGTNHHRSDTNHHCSNTDLGANDHHHFHHHKHIYHYHHHHRHYHLHHDAHRIIHAENGGRKLDSIVDDQSCLLVPRLVYKSQH